METFILLSDQFSLLTTKPHFGVKRIYSIKVRLGGKDNNIKKNPHKWYSNYLHQ